jgi:hypothetical protein
MSAKDEPVSLGTRSMAITSDNLGKAGATRLSYQIKDYWECQGYSVSVRVEIIHVFGEGVWVVRSDMVNGWPKGRGNG